jgi:MOSC domain-containing protein
VSSHASDEFSLRLALGPAGDEWFSAYLGRPVRLVYLDDPTRRAVDPEFGRDGDVVSFADGYPLLLTSTASLDELGRWLTEDGEQPVPMTRFRPNAVVTGAPPWAEDHWRRIRMGTVEFRIVKPCGQCVVTTTDQVTGEVGSQPLKMLGRRRRFGQQLVFGQNMIPDAPGVIQADDPVEILKTT